MRGKFLLTAAACLLLAGSAYANTSTGTLDLRYVECKPAQWVGIHLDSVIQATVGTGIYELELRPLYDPYPVPPGGKYEPTGEGWSFYEPPLVAGASAVLGTFCADVHQSVPSTSRWKTYEVRYPEDAPIGLSQPAMGTDKADDLSRLFANHDGILETTSSLYAAAFQLCVWEIIYETEQSTYSVAYRAGSFYATNSTDVRNLANEWLAPINSATGPAPDVGLRVLSNNCYQDYAITTEIGETPYIPEPLTVLGVFLGVGGLAGYVRKRRMA
jgi:hypothetical protein